MPRVSISAGERFGLLTFTGIVSRVGRRTNYLFACDCGGTTETALWKVRSGHTRSCGCLQRAVARRVNTTHGESGRTGEYRAWVNMKTRCTNQNYYLWHRYGGRGVTVCREWLESYEAFRAHVGPKPALHYSLDRIDNARGYEPGNVHWIPSAEQSKNREVVQRFTVGDRTHNLVEWSAITGVPRKTIWRRLRDGWLPFDAIYQPTKKEAA